MDNTFNKLLKGYQDYRRKYTAGDKVLMQYLAQHGQSPKTMVVACSDSRVDPALILQCDLGDLFVVRNVANIVPPYEKDNNHHGTSAALEFGINYLKVNHLILLGHSQCGGIRSLVDENALGDNDFISNWVSLVKLQDKLQHSPDEYAKLSLKQSHKNCLSFPWIKEKTMQRQLIIHLWYFDIESGLIHSYSKENDEFNPLDINIEETETN